MCNTSNNADQYTQREEHMTDEQEEDFRKLGALIKKYALVNGKPFAVLSGDLAGMTFVGRWVNTNSITDWPKDASWADVVDMENK
jgi:hypothetical protein